MFCQIYIANRIDKTRITIMQFCLLLQILYCYSSAFSQSLALLHCNDGTHDMHMSHL